MTWTGIAILQYYEKVGSFAIAASTEKSEISFFPPMKMPTNGSPRPLHFYLEPSIVKSVPVKNISIPAQKRNLCKKKEPVTAGSK